MMGRTMVKRPPVVAWVAVAACGVAAFSGLAIAGVFSSSPKDSLPNGKAALLQRAFGAQQRNASMATGTTAHPMPWFQKRWSIRARPHDALIEQSKPFPSSVYLLEAMVWEHWHANWLTNVYAGAFTHDGKHGFVIVQIRPDPLRISLVPNRESLNKPDNVTEHLYRTPKAVGSVKIVAWQGMILTLVPTSGGQPLRFDVRRLRFITPQA